MICAFWALRKAYQTNLAGVVLMMARRPLLGLLSVCVCVGEGG